MFANCNLKVGQLAPLYCERMEGGSPFHPLVHLGAWSSSLMKPKRIEVLSSIPPRNPQALKASRSFQLNMAT